MKEHLAGEYKPRSLLKLPEHIPERARFPVIDAHNHLFGDVPAAEMIEVKRIVIPKTPGKRNSR